MVLVSGAGCGNTGRKHAEPGDKQGCALPVYARICVCLVSWRLLCITWFDLLVQYGFCDIDGGRMKRETMIKRGIEEKDRKGEMQRKLHVFLL